MISSTQVIFLFITCQYLQKLWYVLTSHWSTPDILKHAAAPTLLQHDMSITPKLGFQLGFRPKKKKSEIIEQIPTFKAAFTDVWNLVLGWAQGFTTPFDFWKLFIDTM